MNDTHSELGLAQIPDTAPQSNSLWSSTVTFLKRDIKSFFPRDDRSGTPTEQGAGASDYLGTLVPAPVETPIESLVDMSKLPEMAFRRDVIDWRDNFHVNLMNALSRSNDAFAQQVHAELADTSLFRKLVSRESDQVLQHSFTRLVRLPLINALLNEEANLNVCARKWGRGGKGDLTFDLSALNAECASLHDIGFKPSNRDLILSRSKEIIMGPVSLATVFCDQGLHLSRKLMNTKAS